MGNLYQEPDGSFTDEAGVKLFYDAGTDRFYYETGELFIEDFMLSQPQRDGTSNVSENISAGVSGTSNTERHQGELLDEYDADKITPKHMAAGIQSLLSGNTPLTLVVALVLSWLHPAVAGAGVYLVLNNRRIKSGFKAVCLVVILAATIYSTSIETILRSSYSSAERGSTDDIEFVLNLSPGSTTLKELQGFVRNTSYATTSNKSNNSIFVETPTIACTIFFDKAQTIINAIEVRGTANYIATLYPLNVHVQTNAGAYVLNLSEMDVGKLLNGLEARILPTEEYMYNFIHDIPVLTDGDD